MKGKIQYEKFLMGKPLTPKQAILAQCYVCNGEGEGGEDCLGASCPLYQYMPYRKNRKKRELSAGEKAIIVERFKKSREPSIITLKQ